MALTIINLMLYDNDGRKWLPYGPLRNIFRLYNFGKITKAQAVILLEADMAIHAKGQTPPTLTDDDKDFLQTLAALDEDLLEACLCTHERNPEYMTKVRMQSILGL